MKTKILLYPVTLLAGLLAFCGPIRADQQPAKDGKGKEQIDVRTLLEKGQAAGLLPDGMVVRIGACLGESDVKTPKDQEPDELHEMWEFTSNQVHRVELESKDGQYIYPRLESRPFDSKGICKDLLDGKAIEIQVRKGEGPKTAFVGTHYGRGSRTIEIVWKGQTILNLGETNGAFLDVYNETDARAFGALYERLAEQARLAFKAKAADAK
jgi:hypothetical protein